MSKPVFSNGVGAKNTLFKALCAIQSLQDEQGGQERMQMKGSDLSPLSRSYIKTGVLFHHMLQMATKRTSFSAFAVEQEKLERSLFLSHSLGYFPPQSSKNNA